LKFLWFFFKAMGVEYVESQHTLEEILSIPTIWL
jgi:hypothetical protein